MLQRTHASLALDLDLGADAVADAAADTLSPSLGELSNARARGRPRARRRSWAFCPRPLLDALAHTPVLDKVHLAAMATPAAPPSAALLAGTPRGTKCAASTARFVSS